MPPKIKEFYESFGFKVEFFGFGHSHFYGYTEPNSNTRAITLICDLPLVLPGNKEEVYYHFDNKVFTEAEMFKVIKLLVFI